MTKLVKTRKKKKAAFLYIATCGAGLENLVAEEIREHGGTNIIANLGAVSWEGNLEAGYKLCLWSRFASRVLLQIAQFDAPDTDTLYRQAGKIDWGRHFSRQTTFAIFSTITDSPITHSKFAALRVKDAIVDQFRSRSGKRPNVDTSQPGMRFNLHLHGPQATLAIDLAGDSLHRRGYRLAGGEAPLKETLAAGIVQLAGFTDDFAADNVLLDPMCGSGTLLIEAAMIYGHTAPGLQRDTFGFMFWEQHNPRLWEKLIREATDREDARLQVPWPKIIGYDADPETVSAARKNIHAAGFEDRIEVFQGQLASLERPAKNGMVLINPPYGERLSDRETVKHLYRCIGRTFSQKLSGWQIGFFSANPDLADNMNQDWSESFKLFNGSIRCRLHQGIASEPALEPPFTPELHAPEPGREAEDFGNQLVKNCETLYQWAQKETISNFRIYDNDLPEYYLAVDLYDKWVHVHEHAPPVDMSQEEVRHRFNIALQVIREVLAVPPSRVFFSRQHRGPAPKKTGKKPPKDKIFEVTEQECRFLVNFTRQPEADLPLILRDVRLMIGELARGKAFLNLFGGTGTATVHAMQNNALTTTTVEPLTLLAQRARANFALNGFGGSQHEIIRDECIRWLDRNRSRYGVILINPPAHDGDMSFQIQDHHEELLRQAMQHLAREGLLIFVVNQPEFQLAETLQEEFTVREISDQIQPEDFKRSSQELYCWEFRHHHLETVTDTIDSI